MKDKNVLGILLEKLYGLIELPESNTLREDCISRQRTSQRTPECSVGLRRVQALYGSTISFFLKHPNISDYEIK